MKKHYKNLVSIVGEVQLLIPIFLLTSNVLVNKGTYVTESDSESMDVDYVDREDETFHVPTQQERRNTSKKNWVTPRLCAALDKAKVKRMKI